MTRSFITGFVCFTFTVLNTASVVASSDLSDLAKEKDCFSCHSVEKKIIGPAYKDVASKYSGQTGIEDTLTQKVLRGGSGVWGAMSMPPNIQVTEVEARKLVKWVLQLK
jgi:cytochrome c